MLAENGSGLITDYELYKGNPTDDSLLPDTIKSHIDLFDKSPETVSDDCGFGTKENEKYLASVGVKNICISRHGKKAKRGWKLKREQPSGSISGGVPV